MEIKDVLVGIAIADAFGTGIEFQDRRWIQDFFLLIFCLRNLKENMN
jgi:hypothetical protein